MHKIDGRWLQLVEWYSTIAPSYHAGINTLYEWDSSYFFIWNMVKSFGIWSRILQYCCMPLYTCRKVQLPETHFTLVAFVSKFSQNFLWKWVGLNKRELGLKATIIKVTESNKKKNEKIHCNETMQERANHKWIKLWFRCRYSTSNRLQHPNLYHNIQITGWYEVQHMNFDIGIYARPSE